MDVAQKFVDDYLCKVDHLEKQIGHAQKEYDQVLPFYPDAMRTSDR